jgi:DNA polymerase-1
VIAVVDGNSLMHRAFHAIPPTMMSPDGRPTNAVFGFTSMFVKMVETFAPNGVICAFDKGKPRVRMEMLPQYKAQRPPMDPALHEQFPMVKELLRSMDVPVVELEGWEGDDILGTLAKQGEQAGYLMYLVTGDRDMYQLSTDSIHIVGTRKGLSDVQIMTPETVFDLYNGITPALVPDFYGLKGDTSDNIPGVPGIGPKKAAALITRYGSLDEVIAHAGEVKGKMGENLRAHAEDALLSRKIATIRTDAPLDFELASAKFPTWDPALVRQEFSRLGFTGLMARVLALGEGSGGVAASSVAPVSVAAPLAGTAAQAALDAAVGSGEWLGVDYDDGEEDVLPGMGSGHRLWVSCEGGLLRFDDDAADAVLERLVRGGRVAADDVKGLVRTVCPADSALPARIEPSDLDPGRIFDVAVAGYLLDSSKNAFEARELAEQGQYLEQALPEPSEDVPEAAIDAVACRLLRPVLAARLESDGSASCFHEIEMPLVGVLLAIERAGMYVDPSILAEQSLGLGADIEAVAARIHEAAGEDFNIDSPMQLSHVLFDVMGLPTAGLKKTSRGFYSTNAKVLDDLALSNSVVADVLEYREKAKIKSTYLDALPQLVATDGRIHTTLNQTVAATGRLSSSNPNLQNIPVRSELGRRVRQAFGVGEGNVFLACDYSQIELRLLAHLSGDEHLVEAFNSGADFHAATAARVFGVPVSEVTPALRSRAKAVNFGIVYGQQAYGLSQSLKISRGEAQEMIDRYFAAYPDVRSYLDRLVAEAKRSLCAVTMYGRKRRIPELAARNRQLAAFGERTAMNHPMQGSAADIIKLAMIRVEERLAEEGLASTLIMQIHDELDFEAPEGEIEALSSLVKETMEGVVELKVPLIAEVSWGKTWAEAK